MPAPLIAVTFKLGTSEASGSVSLLLPSLLVIRLVPDADWSSLMLRALFVAVGAALPATGTLVLSPLVSEASSGSMYEAARTTPWARFVKPEPLKAASNTPVFAPVWVKVNAVPLTVTLMVLFAVALASSRSVTRRKLLAPGA